MSCHLTPELFVPTTSGRIDATRGAARDIRIQVQVNGSGEAGEARMAATGRQIARAVRRAMEQDS